MIISKSNKQIKNIRELLESHKERTRQGTFVIEGSRLVSEAEESVIEKVYVSESYISDKEAYIPKNADIEVVADDIFRAVSDTVNPQGISAIVKQPKYSFEDVLEKDIYLMLDDIRDPGNLGTMIRTCEAAGAGVFMSSGCADIFNPKVIRSTMGSIFRVPFVICDLKEAIGTLKKEHVTVCAATLDGAVPYHDADISGRAAYIIGNEARGVSADIIKASDIGIKIPMKGCVESLNAAISAAILLYSRPHGSLDQ